jgi:hypothetical protein
MSKPKDERFAIFLGRLADAPPVNSAAEALKLLSDMLNAVEDEFSDIPFDPNASPPDDRMYPPQEDNARAVPGRDDLVRYRSRGHNTHICSNGPIEIRELNGSIVFEKFGADGLGVRLGGE